MISVRMYQWEWVLDSQLCMRPMPIAVCTMSRVKTTAMSVFSISSPHSKPKLQFRLHNIEHKSYRKSISMKNWQRKIKTWFRRSWKKKIYCKVLVPFLVFTYCQLKAVESHWCSYTLRRSLVLVLWMKNTLLYTPPGTWRLPDSLTWIRVNTTSIFYLLV